MVTDMEAIIAAVNNTHFREYEDYQILLVWADLLEENGNDKIAAGLRIIFGMDKHRPFPKDNGFKWYRCGEYKLYRSDVMSVIFNNLLEADRGIAFYTSRAEAFMDLAQAVEKWHSSIDMA